MQHKHTNTRSIEMQAKIDRNLLMYAFVYMIFMLTAQLLTNDDDYAIRELFTNLIFAYTMDEERTSKQRHN